MWAIRTKITMVQTIMPMTTFVLLMPPPRRPATLVDASRRGRHLYRRKRGQRRRGEVWRGTGRLRCWRPRWRLRWRLQGDGLTGAARDDLTGGWRLLWRSNTLLAPDAFRPEKDHLPL